MIHHPQWNYPNDELIRVHSLSDDPLIRLLVSRLEVTNESLTELEASESEIIQEQADEIKNLTEQIDNLNKEIEDLYEKHNL